MGTRLPAPPPGTKCVCGHRYSEHVPGGDRHACQHGAEPPFTNLCPCNHFRENKPSRPRKKVGGMPAVVTAEMTGAGESAAAPEPSASSSSASNTPESSTESVPE